MSLKSILKVANYYSVKYKLGSLESSEEAKETNYFVMISPLFGDVTERYDVTGKNWEDVVEKVKNIESLKGRKIGMENYVDINKRKITLYDNEDMLEAKIIDRDYEDRKYRWQKEYYAPACGNGSCDGTCRKCDPEAY
jgi:hypothetical protein